MSNFVTMGSPSTAFSLVLLALLLCSCSYAHTGTNASYDGRALIINGQRRVIISGSIHYPRSTAEMWPHLIQKAKDGGLDAIETYIFWDVHEPRPREYNFNGNLDFIRFFKTVHQAGLYAILRIGPYVCAEWNYGGFPVWLHNKPGVELRTDNDIYKAEMQNFTTLIVNMVKQSNLLAGQGGPVILTQIENEYGNIQGPYGARGKSYIEWCAKLAISQDVGVPWIMCQQNDAPQPMINTCNGFYCHDFKPNNPNSPKMWTENWVGWFKGWGGRDPHRPAEDVAYGVARFFQTGGTLQNYYMYHGGTNFGRTSGGPFITTSYDYDAPLDEYGSIRQPKWGHLKKLHEAIKSMEKALTYGDVSNETLGNDVEATIYTYNGNSGCFLNNKSPKSDATVNFKGKDYSLPAWSISILPDCQHEVFNTAKVTAQTSLTVKRKIGGENGEGAIKWQWRAEKIKGILRGRDGAPVNKLLEQIQTTVDVSDYLWYTTSVRLSRKDPSWSKQMILRVNTTGHGLYVFVNRKLVGSQYAQNGNYQFVFEQNVNVKPGINFITLLSVTVGLKNYGSFYDLTPAGIVGGPVQLIGNGNVTIDLSTNRWLHKIGLNSEKMQLHSDESRFASKFSSKDLPTNKFMTWYKGSFNAPSTIEPLVVDLRGMGKGHAWVNGRSIGRYWPTNLAPTDGCSPCNYRGAYDSKNCATGCGEPIQRWYHVPASFLKKGTNTLVLFEESGGDPANVSFQTVTAGTVCASVSERSIGSRGRATLDLSCEHDRTISEIQFASFGNPQGTCGSFQKGTCDTENTLSVVQQACVGKASCSITLSDNTFGRTNTCRVTSRTLTVQAVC